MFSKTAWFFGGGTTYFLKEWFFKEIDNYIVHEHIGYRVEFHHTECDVTPHGKSSIIVIDMERGIFHWYETHPYVTPSKIVPLNKDEIEYLKLKYEI